MVGDKYFKEKYPKLSFIKSVKIIKKKNIEAKKKEELSLLL